MTELNLNNIKQIYFLGIGGIGMSALARYFNLQGKVVAGYDRAASELTSNLIKEGVLVQYKDDLYGIPFTIENLKSPECLVVYTPAISQSTKIFAFLQSEGVPMYKRADVLANITAGYKVIAVAGTHGKTTVSTMIAHILHACSQNSWAFLGGIAGETNSNFYHPADQTRPTPDSIFVVEADEYDRSFLKLDPDIAVITAMEADHLDIYGDFNELKKSFNEFSTRVKPSGILIRKSGLEVKSDRSIIEYSAQQPADVCARNIRVQKGVFMFDLMVRNEKFEDFQSPMPGRHNIENALAAIVVCLQLGIGLEKIKNSIARFKGIRRRFELLYESEEFTVIDDYAHHPGEIRAAIDAVRELYPGKRLNVIFQPHLFSRTRDFSLEFAKSLSEADELLLMDIYPAREEPILGVTSKLILDGVSIKASMLREDELPSSIAALEAGIVLILGAGSIDKQRDIIVDQLKKKQKINQIA